MIKQILAIGGISIGLGVTVCSAQAPTQKPPQAQQPAPSKAWTAPKTPWGEPDLQGIWPLNHLISTPLQRQQRYGNRQQMTDEEFAAAQKAADARNKRFESGAIPQADSGTQVMRLTSLINEPADGRFPALTPKGKEMYY